MNSIPLWKCTTFSISLPLWRDIWVFLASGVYRYGCYELRGACVLITCWKIFCMPSTGIAESSGSSTMSNFLRKHQTDFQSSCSCFQSQQQLKRISHSLHACQNLLLPEFFLYKPFCQLWVEISGSLDLLDFYLPDTKTLNISLTAFWPFEIALLQILCLALQPTFLECLFLWG